MELRLAAMVKWYELGMISQGKAAELAAVSRQEFLAALSRFQVSPFQVTPEELSRNSDGPGREERQYLQVGRFQMADVIDVRDLDEKEIELLEVLVESLKEKAKRDKSGEARKKKDGFKRSAGTWKGLIDPEELIADIYASRLIPSRSEIRL